MGDYHEADKVRRHEPGKWQPLGAERPVPLSALETDHLVNIKRMLERNLAWLTHRHTVLSIPQNVLLACMRIRAKVGEIDCELAKRAAKPP